MKKYDVIVIGSGGGAKITSPAARLGLKVACIEKDSLGGTCLNRGCIPSKMLIHPADVGSALKETSKFDISINPSMRVNFKRLVERISQTVDTDSGRIAAGYTKNPNIDYYKGTAKFISNKEIEVDGEQLTAPKIFIAVGCRPQVAPIEGLEGTPYMTSTEALRNTTLPKKMIVIGAGYIAVELGHAYGGLGTEVHFLVRSQFLRGQDLQVVDEFTKVFSKEYNVHMKAVPTKVEYQNGEFSVYYDSDTGDSQVLKAEALLVATGITSNTDTLNLKATDIKLKEKGLLDVNEYLETTVDGIYGMGDCVGNYYFRHSVNFEGEYLFNSIFKDTPKRPIAYPPIPHAVFTKPQVAGVGLTEEDCKHKELEYVVGLNFYKSSAMGMALLSDHGFCKIIIELKTRKILGAQIIGEEASNMIHMIIAFINKQGTLDDLLNMIYIHPALPEIVRNASRKAEVEYQKSIKAKNSEALTF